MLREQLAAFKAKCTSLEDKAKNVKEQLCNDLGKKAEEMHEKNECLKRIEHEHMLQLNVERDKYQDMLHKYTDLQNEHH